MIKFNRTCGSAGYIKTLLGKTLLGVLFIFLFTSCSSSPSSPSGEGGLKISFQNSSLRQAEGEVFVFILEIDATNEQDISFNWSIEHVTTNNDDFIGATKDNSGIIAANSTTTDIIITTRNNNIFEGDENFILKIENIRGATLDDLQAKGYIVDDNKKLINIATATELNNVRFNLAGTSYKTSLDDTGVNCDDASCEGYELMGNIDLSGFANWNPIGRNPIGKDTSFTSTLKGNSYSISGLNIDELTTDRVGLFYHLLNATIDNLIIKVKTIKGSKFVGALAGRSENSMIDNIQIKKTDANSVLQTSGGYAGALIGEVVSSVITNAFSDLNITTIVTSSGISNIGGLVGDMSKKSRISYSAASGNLDLKSSGVDYGGLVGGLRKSDISYSWASGNLQSSTKNLFGGFVGRASAGSSISYSWASGSVKGDITGSFVGNNYRNIEYNYSLGSAPGRSAFISSNANSGTSTTNNYWNIDTSKVTKAVGNDQADSGISSSDTDSMLTSSGSASDTAFSTWSNSTDDSNNAVWNFVDASSYPVLRGQDATFQAINLAYGLLRLASSDNADSFLGSTVINENITLNLSVIDVADLQNDFAILDVNLRASNDTSRSDFFACTGGNTLVSQSINGTSVELSINQQGTSSNLLNGLDFNKTNCSVSFKDTVTLTSGKTLRLDAKVSKGTGKWEVSQTKVFIINFVE